MGDAISSSPLTSISQLSPAGLVYTYDAVWSKLSPRPPTWELERRGIDVVFRYPTDNADGTARN